MEDREVSEDNGLDDLDNIEAKTKDDDKTLLSLSSSPISFEYFKDVILYGKEDTITLDEVQKTVRSKDFFKVKDLKINDSGENLSVSRGGSERRGMSKSNRFDKSMVKYFTCKKNHFMRDCPKKRGEQW